jgi:hypothetical protein
MDPSRRLKIEGNLQSVFDLLKAATSRFLLKELTAPAQHDFGWVLSDFCEFVTIDRHSRESLQQASKLTMNSHV